MVVSYALTLKLFVDCNSIREYCNRLQAEADKMREVSMNAAIAAGHTGGHIRTFTEIARQIGHGSTRLSERVQKIRRDTNSIVNETLDAMIRATQLSRFDKCLAGIKQEPNVQLVEDRMREFRMRICRSIEKIYVETQVIISDLKTVEEIQKRVWAVITRLRIEASTLEPEEQLYIASIADSLSESIDRSSAAFTRLFETVRQFERKLDEPIDNPAIEKPQGVKHVS